MESVRFHDSKLKLLKALLFCSFHENEAPTALFCSVFICRRAYWLSKEYFIMTVKCQNAVKCELYLFSRYQMC